MRRHRIRQSGGGHLRPLSGEVIATNDELDTSPQNINEDAYGAWIFKLSFRSG